MKNEMKKLDHGKVLDNRVVAGEGRVVFCENCDERMVFAMRDKGHDFSVGLSTILLCLELAEKEGCVPKLPDNWWLALSGYVRRSMD